jgi:hypothetical protein
MAIDHSGVYSVKDNAKVITFASRQFKNIVTPVLQYPNHNESLRTWFCLYS